MESKKGNFKGIYYEIIVSDNAINNGFKVGKPTDLEMIITNKYNEQYQADVFLKNGWTPEDLNAIIVGSIVNCVVSIKSLKATIKGIVSAN